MSLNRSHFFVRGPCAFLRPFVFTVIAITALACGVALAQTTTGPPRVDEPPLPPPGGGQSQTLWQDVLVPLATGASLGALWTNDPNQVYVWTIEGQGTAAPRSRLLHLNGTAWSVVLDVVGETGVSVYGNCTNDIFAATSTVVGTARMYHFNGAVWTEQALPAGTVAPAGAIAGKLDDVYFRSGYDILRNAGSGWHRLVTSDDDFANALAYIGPGEIYANCCTGHCSWDGMAWAHHNCGSFLSVGSAWGVRQLDYSAGMSPLCTPPLAMYAAGRNSDVTDGFAVWKFVEDSPGSMHGVWMGVPLGLKKTAAQPTAGFPSQEDLPPRVPDDPEDPPSGGTPGAPGYGVAVWGSSATDVYAAGVQSGTGLLYHFNGVSWHQLTPIAVMTPIADVWGSGPGDVWVSFTDGRLLHYTGGITNPNPETVEPGTASPLPIAPAPVPGMTGAFSVLETRVLRAGNGVVTLEYAVPADGEVSIAAFDVAGRCAAVIESGWRSSGRYQVDWSTAGLARGVYFCQVRAGGTAVSQRVVVLN